MLVSVIMSVYNTEELWLRQSLESILSQTLKDFEFIIILDCPTDNSAEIVNEYARKDHRIHVLVNESNLGLTKSLNRGLDVAQGKYIARMDADDVAFRHRLEKQYQYMENHPEVVVLGTQICTSLDPKHAMDKFPLCDWTPDQQVLKIRMLFRNAGVPHPTAMIRHDILLQHKIKYDERIKKSQDYKLWIDLMPFGSIHVLNEMLLMYRVHEGQISADRMNQREYACRVSLEQAENLLGDMTKEEKGFHACASTVDLYNNDVKGYGRYMKKLIDANKSLGLYDIKKFHREINYAWIQKAFRRALILHRLDMVFHPFTFVFLRPGIFPYLIQDKKIKRMRKAALAVTDFQDCSIIEEVASA